MATTHGDKGTGKHPHKDSKEPWPHTEGERSGGEDRSFSGSSKSSHRSSGSRSEKESLKEREYRGSDGQIHHHTRTYEQEHKKS